jgi:MFS family permease
LLGVGEAGNYPGGVKVVAEWFPPRERAFAGGVFTSGASIGAVIAAPRCKPHPPCAGGWVGGSRHLVRSWRACPDCPPPDLPHKGGGVCSGALR